MVGLSSDRFPWVKLGDTPACDRNLFLRWLGVSQRASVQAASRALEALAELVPTQVHRLRNGQVEDVSVG